MTQRLSKLAEYLYNNNFEMAVECHQTSRDGRKYSEQPQEVQILLAKAYFLNEKYPVAIEMATRLKASRKIKIIYEAHFLEFKALYMQGQVRPETLDNLLIKLKRENVENLSSYKKQIEEVLSVVNRKTDNMQYMGRSTFSSNQRRQFEAMLKEEDDRSIVMEGIPMFLVSKSWFDAWKDYTSSGDKFQKEKSYPGPITQFDLVDHIYNIFFDNKSSKDYTNRYVFPSGQYEVLPKKCWVYLRDKYGGIEVKRTNISFIDKPYEIFTEVHLKQILIARYDKEGSTNKNFVLVQITKKQTWEGLKQKLAIVWGNGQICYQDGGKNLKAVTEKQIFEEIDTVGKKYIYLKGEDSSGKVDGKAEKCNNRKCSKTDNLKFCQCKAVKYCNIDCLKEDWKYHKTKCETEQEYLMRKPVTFKEYNLEEKDYGGRKGIVGLKNLGNTCYMNSGLQCLSNTRELTDYFMKDEFKSHINHSNPLGTKGNLACAYAELIRQMWTGTSDALAPTRLKKKIGEFATQFSGYGQQDSQQFISYLIDGLQEDLNLVKKKQTFEIGDQKKSDEQMSRQRELNDSKRIQSYIRKLMVGHFKSTVICGSCHNISVCMDPYMLITLPIPSSKDCYFYFVSSIVDKGALKISIQYSNVTTLRGIACEFSRVYNSIYYRQLREGTREKAHEERMLFLTLDGEKFAIMNFHQADDKIINLNSAYIIFFMQIPICKKDEELILCQYEYNGERCTYPRFLKFSKGSGNAGKEEAIHKSILRGLDKGAPRGEYSDLVMGQSVTRVKDFPFPMILVKIKRRLKLSTFTEGHHDGFNRRISEDNEAPISLYDCFKSFAQKEKLEKENTVYCGKCKEHKQATKQMQIYKTNKVLVLAFKRFSRHRKITIPIDFPIDGLDIGPYILSNKNKEPVIYDLYGVVNHHGSLYGGHYTAYCLNFLDRRWYEFNDSRVSHIGKNQIVSGYSYVLFYRKREN